MQHRIRNHGTLWCGNGDLCLLFIVYGLLFVRKPECTIKRKIPELKNHKLKTINHKLFIIKNKDNG